MSSDKDYLDYILEQLSGLEITYRKMMGEYIIYCSKKIVGGIYDNRFLVKPTESALRLITEKRWELPYSRGKEMLMPDSDDSEFLQVLIKSIAEDMND